MAAPRTRTTLVIGGANLDLTGSCFNRLIPGDSNPGVVQSSAGGVGRNIAENLARLDVPCTLVAPVGDDFGQQVIRESCVQSGVNADNLLVYPDAATGTYLAINNQLGTLLAAISDMAVVERLTPEVLAENWPRLPAHERIVAEANLSSASLAWIAAHKGGAQLCIDAVSATKAPHITDILPAIDLLKVNRDEAAAILRSHGDDTSQAQALLDRGVKEVLFSQGSQGAMLVNAQGQWHKPAIAGDNASDTGAGDALIAGYLASERWLADVSLRLEFATACATLALNSRKTVNPDLNINTVRHQFLSHFEKSAWLP